MSAEIAQDIRPRRSVLYMPGANARAMERARTLDADALIFDLEDAVAPDAKTVARSQVVAALSQGGYGYREIVVRINGFSTPWGREDLAAVAKLGPNAILVPKVESTDQVREVASFLEAASAPADLHVWAMIETPRAILKLGEIAASHPLLKVLVMGTSDLVKDMHARHTSDRMEVVAALSMAVLAARANGLAVLDGVHLALGDGTGLRLVCEQGRNLGFDGKTLIHPDQITAANEAFGPSPEEVADARKRVAAFTAARDAGEGIVVVDGKLVEELHIQEAKRILALAASITSR